MHSFARAASIANLVNPALTVWALLVLWRTLRQARARGEEGQAASFGRTLGVWLGAVLLVFVVAHANRWGHLWHGHKYFPSGHAAYASCVATLGWARQRRSIFFTAPLILLYSLLMVRLGYHVWLDIIGALAFAPLLTWLVLSRFSPPSATPASDPETVRA